MTTDKPWRMGVREEAAPYKSEPQNVRVWTESWVKNWMYCPSCGSAGLSKFTNNNPASDFVCGTCREEFELKSSRKKFGKRIVDGALATMSRRVAEAENPSLLLLQYDRDDLQVRNLLAIPRQFITQSVIEPRRPLSATARRAGWVGCNILLGQLPAAGRIAVVRDQEAVAKELVQWQWRRISFLSHESETGKGWLMEVMKCIENIGRAEFTLADIYAYEEHFKRRFPGNSHIRPKVRQQLQVLRDGGYLDFVGRGEYRLRAFGGLA